MVAVGSEVKTLHPGDEVYGMDAAHPVIPWSLVGYCSEYVVTKASYVLRKPSHLSMEEAVSLLASVITAYQGFKLGMSVMPGSGSDKLEGKTVFVPAALGSTGFVACQMLKKVYGAGKVIATVSTPKVPMVDELMPGVVDQIVDYKTQDVVEEVGRGRVDFVYNTIGGLSALYPIISPDTGVVVAIAGAVPKSDTLRSLFGDLLPIWVAWICDLAQYWYTWKLRGTNIKQECFSANPGVRQDLEASGEIIATGKLKAVMRVVDLSDLEAVRRECGHVETMTGGVGKLIIKIA